jgi:hypothetical protein
MPGIPVQSPVDNRRFYVKQVLRSKAATGGQQGRQLSWMVPAAGKADELSHHGQGNPELFRLDRVHPASDQRKASDAFHGGDRARQAYADTPKKAKAGRVFLVGGMGHASLTPARRRSCARRTSRSRQHHPEQ